MDLGEDDPPMATHHPFTIILGLHFKFYICLELRTLHLPT